MEWGLRSKESTVNSLMQEVKNRKKQLQKKIMEWVETNLREFPWRQSPSPYEVLIAEILLKRTTSTAVKKLFPRFIREYMDINELARANIGDLQQKLAPLGYHKERAKIFVEVATQIIQRHDGKIPRTKTDLLEIRYIGEYTANAILSIGYGIPSAMVDSNGKRIITRLFSKHFLQKPSLKIVQEIADLLSPIENNQKYNYALLDLGALICRYGIPKCELCPIRRLCDYPSLDGVS